MKFQILLVCLIVAGIVGLTWVLVDAIQKDLERERQEGRHHDH